jgi:hypothetical protein
LFFAPGLFDKKKTKEDEKDATTMVHQKDKAALPRNSITIKDSSGKSTPTSSKWSGNVHDTTLNTTAYDRRNLVYKKDEREKISSGQPNKIVSSKPVEQTARVPKEISKAPVKEQVERLPSGTREDTSRITPDAKLKQPAKGDTFKKENKMAIPDSPRVVVQQPNKIAPQKRPFYFAAGLSLQQQIPFAGQEAVPYSYYGRKFSLSDYIPAPFVRLYKDDLWFLQLEFRYGAPQAAKELSYSVTTLQDSATNTTSSTTLRLKKTWYHQAPLTFNYYILPRMSFGTGIMYSRFERAITEEEFKTGNNSTQVETITRKVITIPSTTDSFFTKSQVHLVLQGEYQYKKFGGGLRYTNGLKPFIRYTENGVLKEEKNHSLELFIRYQLFHSK